MGWEGVHPKGENNMGVPFLSSFGQIGSLPAYYVLICNMKLSVLCHWEIRRFQVSRKGGVGGGPPKG